MTLTGSYKEHTEYVLAKMKKRCKAELKALAEDDLIPRGGIKELAVTSGIVSIFRATAGVVPWTGAELIYQKCGFGRSNRRGSTRPVWIAL